MFSNAFANVETVEYLSPFSGTDFGNGTKVEGGVDGGEMVPGTVGS